MNNGPRYLIAIASSAVITFLLFALMIVLIKNNQLPSSSSNRLENVAFLHVDRELSLNTEQLRPAPTPPPTPQAPPQTAAMQVGDVGSGDGAPRLGSGTGPVTDGFSWDGVDPGAGGIGSGIGSGLGTGSGFGAEIDGDGVIGGGDYLPIVQVPPLYPPSALKQGIEGWVLVEFTIGTEGQVKTARIIQSDPPGIFDEPALKAAQRFRFRPRMVGSVAVEVTGVQNRIRFRLAKP